MFGQFAVHKKIQIIRDPNRECNTALTPCESTTHRPRSLALTKSIRQSRSCRPLRSQGPGQDECGAIGVDAENLVVHHPWRGPKRTGSRDTFFVNHLTGVRVDAVNHTATPFQQIQVTFAKHWRRHLNTRLRVLPNNGLIVCRIFRCSNLALTSRCDCEQVPASIIAATTVSIFGANVKSVANSQRCR